MDQEIIRSLLAGEPATAVARRMRIRLETVQKIARSNGIRYRQQHLTSADRQAIDDLRSEGLSVRKIAQAIGKPRSTVGDHIQRSYIAGLHDAEWEAMDALEPDEPLEVDFSRSVDSYRCPHHGSVSVWPCVACAAESRLLQSGRR